MVRVAVETGLDVVVVAGLVLGYLVVDNRRFGIPGLGAMALHPTKRKLARP